jgi:GMP synthase (glutamine-hydrolysing)
VQTSREAADDPLLGRFPARFSAFEWHHYRFAPPPGARLLAQSAAAPQAFRAGELAWGLQFHIEVDESIATHWLELGRPELDAHGLDHDALVAETRRQAGAYGELARELAAAFGSVMVDVAERRGPMASARR